MIDERRKKEQDSFWDIEKLVPPKRGTLTHFSSGQSLTAVTVPASPDAPCTSPSEGRLTVLSRDTVSDVCEHVYVPEYNPLLLRVTVRRSVGGHSFYEQFRRDAERYFDLPGRPAAYVPFFSFSPQYNQLSPEQKEYYLYLRSEVRAGRYPRADKGYFFLLVYEILTLEDRIAPDEGARLLSGLWAAYRPALPDIDRYMAPWLTDYCLLHAIPCPAELSPECLAAAAELDGVEFFFGNASTRTPEGVMRLLTLCSEYRFEQSRAFTEETRLAFSRHITGVMAQVFSHLLATGHLALSERPETMRHRAFFGSLCAHNARAELCVEYISLRRAEGLRRTVTLAVKYAENRLRAAFGIRARLSAVGLPAEVAEVIDRYFDSVAAGLAPKRPAPPPPSYERLYDAPDRGLDVSSAVAIEAASWELTKRLVGEEGEDIAPGTPAAAAVEDVPAAVADEVPSTEDAAASTLSGDALLLAAVEAFLQGEEATAVLSRHTGMPPALLAERVNEGFLAAFGDVLLETDAEGGFVLIEEYREDAQQWLKTL